MPHLGELFTNRVSEAEAFKNALAEFRRELDCDGETPLERTNLLVYYGMGGIGKTALSRRLEEWIHRRLPLINGWGPPPATRVDASVRVDLHSSLGRVDGLALLLALRSQLGGIKSRWPLFDLTYTAYWSAVHPGEDLNRYPGGSQLSAAAMETIADVLSDIGSMADLTGAAVGGGLAARGVKRLIAEIRRRKDLRLGLAAYEGFTDFLIQCADGPSPTSPSPDLLCEIASILAWEIGEVHPHPVVTVFVDTTERLKEDPRRSSENLLNLLVYKMPNVMFVITGRDVLDWHEDSRLDLTYRGRWCWPSLMLGAEKTRQHLVGRLSPQDSLELLRRSRDECRLPIDDALLEKIVDASDGLPQYLELARQVAISVKESRPGDHVKETDVTGSLASLVDRVLEDVPADEQRVIRAGALFRSFDVGLVAAAAGVEEGCVLRAVQRPMIDKLEGQVLPYRMHDAVREALRRVDHEVVGGWAEADWSCAATRAMATLKMRHDAAKEADDDRGTLEAIAMAISLACEQETKIEAASSPSYRDWLSQAIVRGPSIQGLRARTPAQSQTEYGALILQFIDGMTVSRTVDQRVDDLRTVFASDHPLKHPAGRHLGYLLKLEARWEESLSVFKELISLAPSEVHRRQVPDVLSVARRFQEAEDASRFSSDVAHVINRRAAFFHGRPEAYLREAPELLRELHDNRRRREYLEELGTFLMRRAIFAEGQKDSEAEQLLHLAEVVGHNVGVRGALATMILLRSKPGDEIAFLIQELRERERVVQATQPRWFRYATAVAADAIVRADRERVNQLAHEISSAKGVRSRNWIPVEMLLHGLGYRIEECETQWLEPIDTIRERWLGHWERYFARHGVDVRPLWVNPSSPGSDAPMRR